MIQFHLYLFLIATEGFSALLYDVVQRNIIQGVRVARHCPLVSHLLFADDTLIFARASPTVGGSLANILGTYCQASGQHINWNKTMLALGRRVPPQRGQAIARELGISISPLPKFSLFSLFKGQVLVDGKKNFCQLRGVRF